MKISEKVQIFVFFIVCVVFTVCCSFFFLNKSKKQELLRSNFLSVPIMPEYYQVFPIDRYPGLKCYVFASTMRYYVLTQNCNTIYMDRENITVENYVIPRQTPNKRCNRCYFSDYLNTLSLLLYGYPELNIPPLAPKGVLILEDDVVVCNKALDVLDKCFEGQYNCLLGWGAWANFYAAPNTTQLDPAKHSKKRFHSREDLFSDGCMSWEPNVDFYIRTSNRHVVRTDHINHVGVKLSVMNHTSPGGIKCSMEDSIAKKVIAKRFKDIDIFVQDKNDVVN